MAQKTRLTAAEWQRHIAAQQASGQTQLDYCQEQGLSIHSFREHKHPRRKTKSRQDSVDPLTAWLALPSGPVPGHASSGWLIELDLGNGVCLRLRQG